MKKKIITMISATLVVAALLCSCGAEENNKAEIASSTPVIAQTPTPTPHLDIPNEQQLIQCYTDVLAKLTDSSIVSTTYEKYEPNDSDSRINIIAKMDDGKTIDISAWYFDNEKWNISLIKNMDNEHSYYLPDDLKLIRDLYDYDTDNKIPKEQFTDSYRLGKMDFQFSSDWIKTKDTDKQYIFQDNKKLYFVSAMVSKAPYKSMDKIWNALSTSYDNYTLIDKSSLKVGGKKATQWKFTYDQGLTSCEAMTTMIINKSNVYLFIWMSQFGLGQYDCPAYTALLESVTWDK